MDAYYSIQPIPYTGPVKIVTKVKISVIKLVLFQSVDICVQYLDENDYIIENIYLTISGDDYLLWSDDDNYILEYVKNNCNVNFTN